MGDADYKLGAFTLAEPIGRGGMASVWSVRDERFGWDAALKVMESAAARSERYRRAFRDEARSHARLDHPNIVQLLDYGAVAASDLPPEGALVGDPYLVMERADGTLRDRAQSLSWRSLNTALLQVLDALAYSHARGVVHRDLKPENVLTFGAGTETRFKLSDFGIAHSSKLDETADSDALSVMVGTPNYMAPEQFTGRWYEFGPWTDLYALGCVAYELATGFTPFSGRGIFELATKHAAEPMPEPDFGLDVPPDFERWLARLLEKAPEARFSSAVEAAHSLIELGRGFRGSERSGLATTTEGDVTELLDFADGMTTLHDALDFGTAETLLPSGAVLESSGDAYESDDASIVTPIEISSVPVPRSWGRETHRDSVRRGLGLFAFRQPPLIGLREERDKLWTALFDVVATGKARAVVLNGAAQAPLVALAQWLAVRAAELGVADTLELSHSRAGGPREGLVGMFEDLAGTWALEDAAIRERVSHVTADAPQELRALYTEAISAEILRARGANESAEPVSRAQLARMTGDLLARRASRRPLVFRVVESQWSEHAMLFVRELLESIREAPLLVVVTVRNDGDPRPVGFDDELGRVEQLDRTDVIDVREYSQSEHGQLVRWLVPLDSASVDSVAAVSGRDAVATRLVLSELRDRDAIAPTPSGFVADTTSLEDSLVGVMRRRAARTLAGDLDIGFRIAGVLGRSPDPNEIVAAGQALGLQIDKTELADLLLQTGLASGAVHRWSLAHDAIVRVARDRAREDGAFRRIHAACARGIIERASLDVAEPWLRAARHFRVAGAVAEAVEATYQAAPVLFANPERYAALLEERQALLETMGVTPEARESIDQDVLRVPQLWSSGERDKAFELAEDAARRASEIGYGRGKAAALRHLARLSIARSELDHAVEHFEAAAAAAVSRLDQAAAVFGRATVWFRRGTLVQAQDDFRRASDLYREAGSPRREALALSYLSAALLGAGEVDAADEEAQRALRIALKSGQLELVASIGQDLAELARFRNDLVAARRHYEEARHLRQLLGLDVATIDLNLGLLAVAEGRLTEASERIASAEAIFEARGLTDILPTVAAAKGAIAAASGEAQVALESVDAAVEGLGERANRDVAWVLERVIPATSGDLRARLIDVVSVQYDQLADDARAAAVRAMR